MKEYKVGQRIVLEVQENPDGKCGECFFVNLGFCACYQMCLNDIRSDGKNVIFKEISNGKE